MHVLVGVVRPSYRERPKREIELCGCLRGCVSGVTGKLSELDLGMRGGCRVYVCVGGGWGVSMSSFFQHLR